MMTAGISSSSSRRRRVTSQAGPPQPSALSKADLFGEFFPGLFFEVDSFSFSVGIESEADSANHSQAAAGKAGPSPSAIGKVLGDVGYKCELEVILLQSFAMSKTGAR